MVQQDELKSVTVMNEKINYAVKHAIHDMQSPLTCLLLLCDKALQHIPQEQRGSSPDDLADRIKTIIKDIPQQVMRQLNANFVSTITVPNQQICVSQIIERILSEKKIEYANHPITFQYSSLCVEEEAWISANMDDFCRMLSNLFNNAAEACMGKDGKITALINIDDNHVSVSICDNGMGMPEEVRTKILNNVTVTSGKANGQGIGLSHVRDTLAACNAKLRINTMPGIGTDIVMLFPR